MSTDDPTPPPPPTGDQPTPPVRRDDQADAVSERPTRPAGEQPGAAERSSTPGSERPTTPVRRGEHAAPQRHVPPTPESDEPEAAQPVAWTASDRRALNERLKSETPDDPEQVAPDAPTEPLSLSEQPTEASRSEQSAASSRSERADEAEPASETEQPEGWQPQTWRLEAAGESEKSEVWLPEPVAEVKQEPELEHPAEPTPMPKPKPKTPNLALRRLRAGFKPSRGQAIVAIVLALVACMAVVQVRTNRADDGYQNARREDLVAILDGLGQNTRRLETEITELEARKNTLTSSADKAQTAREQAEQQARVLGILAGTLRAQGPGVRITLNDPEAKMTSSNLLDAIEELRDAGAEAIQINGSVRVVASTDLVDDAPGVKVDGEKVQSPYVIEAIGESHNLAEAANFPGGLVSEVTGPQVGGTAEVTEETLIQITALHAPDEHRYARPAPSPTK